MKIFKEKQKKYKEKTNYIQTDIHLIFKPLRIFAVKQILYILWKKSYKLSKPSMRTWG